MSYDAVRHVVVARVDGITSATACASVGGVSLPAGARRVSTQWHPDWKLPTRIAEPGRITTRVFNGQPDPFDNGALAQCAPSTALLPDGKPIVVLCKLVEQATTDASGAQGFDAVIDASVPARATRWTYTAFGQVLTEQDPRGVTTVTNEYYSDTAVNLHTVGDLKTTTNAAGHVISFPRYDVYGQPVDVIDANGVTTTHGYTRRLRLAISTTGGESTTYSYWPTGRLLRITRPDQSQVNYEYDDAGRLKAVVDSLGNRIEYTLDASGNRTQEVAKDPSGQLKRTMSRVFDALGRAQQTTGRE